MVIEDTLRKIEKIINYDEDTHKFLYSRHFKRKKYQKQYSIQIKHNDVVIINKQLTTDILSAYDDTHYETLEETILVDIFMYAMFGVCNMIDESNNMCELKKNK